jgi:hypothetical protein
MGFEEDSIKDCGYFYAPYLDLPKPNWACPQWGNHEHDWLDCPDCVDAYEHELDLENEPLNDEEL